MSDKKYQVSTPMGCLIILVFPIVVLMMVGGNKSGPRPPSDFDRQYAVQQAVKARMKDPDTVKFGEVWVRGTTVCGTVNGKNSFGAYGGFQSFIGNGSAVFFENEVKPKDFNKLWNEKCAH